MELKEVKVGQIVTNILHPEFGDGVVTGFKGTDKVKPESWSGVVTGFKGTDKVKPESWSGAGTNTKPGYGWNSRASELKLVSNTVSIGGRDFKNLSKSRLLPKKSGRSWPNRHNKAWTIAEEEFVQKYWETLGITETAQILERTEDAIRSKLYERG
jgi:hypothetical protein